MSFVASQDNDRDATTMLDTRLRFIYFFSGKGKRLGLNENVIAAGQREEKSRRRR